jgi:SAM-dependent methyltransferase
MSSEKKYFGKDLEAMSFAENYHQWILDEFRPYLGERVAEVGAGTGNFSAFLLQAGVKQLSAFEPFGNMHTLLSQRFADDRRVDPINTFFEETSQKYPKQFDAVCYVNVLEHIEDDLAALRHARATMKDEGHLLVFVPALSFLYSDLDRKVGHFRRYSKAQLENVVRDAGFSIRTLKYFDIMGIIPWYVAFVVMKKTTTSANVSLYDRLVVPTMRRVESLATPFIGKNLILVAQKTATPD